MKCDRCASGWCVWLAHHLSVCVSVASPIDQGFERTRVQEPPETATQTGHGACSPPVDPHKVRLRQQVRHKVRLNTCWGCPKSASRKTTTRNSSVAVGWGLHGVDKGATLKVNTWRIRSSCTRPRRLPPCAASCTPCFGPSRTSTKRRCCTRTVTNWLWIDRTSLPSLSDFETARELKLGETVARHTLYPRPEVPKTFLKKHCIFRPETPKIDPRHSETLSVHVTSSVFSLTPLWWCCPTLTNVHFTIHCVALFPSIARTWSEQQKWDPSSWKPLVRTWMWCRVLTCSSAADSRFSRMCPFFIFRLPWTLLRLWYRVNLNDAALRLRERLLAATTTLLRNPCISARRRRWLRVQWRSLMGGYPCASSHRKKTDAGGDRRTQTGTVWHRRRQTEVLLFAVTTSLLLLHSGCSERQHVFFCFIFSKWFSVSPVRCECFRPAMMEIFLLPDVSDEEPSPAGLLLNVLDGEPSPPGRASSPTSSSLSLPEGFLALRDSRHLSTCSSRRRIKIVQKFALSPLRRTAWRWCSCGTTSWRPGRPLLKIAVAKWSELEKLLQPQVLSVPRAGLPWNSHGAVLDRTMLLLGWVLCCCRRPLQCHALLWLANRSRCCSALLPMSPRLSCVRQCGVPRAWHSVSSVMQSGRRPIVTALLANASRAGKCPCRARWGCVRLDNRCETAIAFPLGWCCLPPPPWCGAALPLGSTCFEINEIM